MRLRSLLVAVTLPLVGCGAAAGSAVGNVGDSSSDAPPSADLPAAYPPPSARSVRLNKPLPPFKRPALDGQLVSTLAPNGKVTVVKFFAKYCKPCRETLPAAEQLHRDNRDVNFIGIDVDEYAAEASELVQAYALSFPVVHDRGFLLAEQFHVTKLPTTFVADENGVVRWVGGPRQRKGDLEVALAWVKHAAYGSNKTGTHR